MEDAAESAEAILLELGLEDWIPIPEGVETLRRRSIGRDDPKKVAESALISLISDGKVRLYRGRWDDNDPAEVPREDATALLRDPRWYPVPDRRGR